MKILWLGKRFYTNTDTFRERFGRMYHLPNEWHKLGHKVLLWLIDYHTHQSEHSNGNGMEVRSTPVFGLAILMQSVRTLVTGRPHCIVASGDCYIGLFGWLLARLSGAKFVFDIYDKYDEFSGYRRLARFDPLSFLIKHSDGLMFASGVLASKLGSNSKASSHVGPNGIDPGQFKPLDLHVCRQALKLPDSAILIGYFGSMEPDRGVADLIEAAKRLRTAGRPVTLLLAGKGGHDLPLEDTWVCHLGMVPHARIPLLLNACDVLVVPYRHGPFVDMVGSCKIAEYLACERPLVATDTPSFSINFADKAVELGAGLCRPSDPQDMARALMAQLDHPNVLSSSPNYNWQYIAEGAINWLISAVAGK